MTRRHDDYKLTMAELRETAEECKNWGRWGPDDQAGTLNFIAPEDIVEAAKLIRKGKTFSLALNFDSNGPQAGLWGNRFKINIKASRKYLVKQKYITHEPC